MLHTQARHIYIVWLPKKDQDQLVSSPGWDTDADVLNIQKCSRLRAGLQTMVVLMYLIKTTWVVLVI